MRKFKVILWLSLVFTTNLLSQTNLADLKSLRLKGRVSNLIEITETCPSQVQESILTLNCRFDSTEYNFDKFGKLTSVIKKGNRSDFYYDKFERIILIKEFENKINSNTWEFHYDPRGNLIEKIFIGPDYKEKVIVKTINRKDTLYIIEYKSDANGRLRKNSEEIFNKDGLKIASTLFDSDEKQYLTWIYTNNRLGYRVKLERYEWWNNKKTCRIEVYQTNKYGDSEKTEYYDCTRLINKDDFSIDYKFDKNKNWITRTVNNSDVITLSRRIYIYY